MSIAYKCDKCGELFDQREQSISITYEKEHHSYLTVTVGQGFDLCHKCTLKFLNEALKKLNK